MRIVAQLSLEAFDPKCQLDELMSSAGGAGAVVSFVGLTRPYAKSGEEVQTLVLEHHPRLTVQSLKRIAAEAADRFEVTSVRVLHRCGRIAPGEPIVFAGAASAHRRAAFEAADYLMDRLKTEAMFWKREEGPTGSRWIEPTEADYVDCGRWE